ncbi:hypothetical protein RAS2_13860 [Phycisphaerae bacterium RAS2]|nr:hypothetical protein RAS2_13860 [Phycisphaerae bacterium RAS2]
MVDESMGSVSAPGTTESGALVEVMYARTLGEATHCCDLLRGQEIQAQIEGGSSGKACGIAVMVPNDRFIEASEFLALNLENSDDDDFSDVDDEEEDDDDDADDFDDDDDDDFGDDDEEEEEEFGTDDEV